ncbi:MAG: DUF1385 domain-containing protein [Bacillota bacterium]
MKKCSIGGQAVMEGVMMKSPEGIAIAVRKPDGSIEKQFKPVKSKAQKGTFYGLPIVRGVVAFIESLTIGVNTMMESARLAGETEEEPGKFEKFLAEKLGKSVDTIIIGIAATLAVVLSVGLFFVLPTLVSSIALRDASIASVWKSILEGFVRLAIFIGYLMATSLIKDVRRVFMYHGAEHKVIACYEAEEELTPQNAMKHPRLHPRCGTNYLFLVMAVSIAFFAVVGWNANFFIRLGMRLLFLPVVAGLSYEVLKLAAKSDGLIARIVRAPGLALQRITTKEPTEDMIEVALAAFELATNPEGNRADAGAQERKEPAASADASVDPAAIGSAAVIQTGA